MKSLRTTAVLAFFGLIALLAFPLTATAQSTFQAVNAIDFGSGGVTSSAGTLTREEDSVELTLALSGLDKKAAYSVWWILFNDGNPCIAAGNCTGADLEGVVNASGFVTGTDGTAYMTAELDVGPLSTGKVFFGELTDGFLDEIHIVIQSHGKTEAGHVAEQISVAGAFCNLKDCSLADQQAVIFPPMTP